MNKPRGRFRRPVKPEDPTKVNDRITAATVLVIDHEGKQLGELAIAKAIAVATEAGLDLVEVAPTAKPPVCRVMDYGKFKFDQQKKAKAAKAKQHVIKIKEIKLHPSTGDNDYSYRLKHAIEFLEKGYKVKASMIFRGREMAHQDFGRKLLDRIVEDLDGKAELESSNKMEGNTMFVIFAPKKLTPAEIKAAERAAKAEEAPDTETVDAKTESE